MCTGFELVRDSAPNKVMKHRVTFVSYKRFGLVDRKGLEVNTCCRQ